MVLTMKFIHLSFQYPILYSLFHLVTLLDGGTACLAGGFVVVAAVVDVAATVAVPFLGGGRRRLELLLPVPGC